MRRRRDIVARVGLLAGLVVVAGSAPAQPAGALPPPAATVAARPDTARLALSLPDSVPWPLAMHVLGDTVSFGGRLAVAWDFPPGSPTPASLPLPVDGQLEPEVQPRRPWWRPGRGAAAPVPPQALASLPPASGPRQVALYRVYRTDPFRLDWEGHLSPVVAVHGRVVDAAKLAAIRDPRAVAWLTPKLALLALALLAVAAAVWWWWRRRGRGPGVADWPLPEPAWIGAAVDLTEHLAARQAERGDQRAALDGLAGIARRFAAAHYGVPATDLTGGELRGACAARGFDPAGADALARLIDDADLRRYDPDPTSAAFHRERVRDLVACMAALRVEPRQTSVAAARLQAARVAWSELVREAALPVGIAGGTEGGA